MIMMGNSSILRVQGSSRTSSGENGYESILNATLIPSAMLSNQGEATSIVIVPRTANIGCYNMPTVNHPATSFTFRAQCPPNRKLVVRRPDDTVSSQNIIDCSSNTSSYVVKVTDQNYVDYFANSGGSVHSLGYDCSRFGGSPIPAYFGYTYRPVFDLYENNAFLKTVQADVAIVELLGQNSFSLLSSHDVRCKYMLTVSNETFK
jgi:hypothetical protein